MRPLHSLRPFYATSPLKGFECLSFSPQPRATFHAMWPMPLPHPPYHTYCKTQLSCRSDDLCFAILFFFFFFFWVWLCRSFCVLHGILQNMRSLYLASTTCAFASLYVGGFVRSPLEKEFRNISLPLGSPFVCYFTGL